jgi:hypothetical protein
MSAKRRARRVATGVANVGDRVAGCTEDGSVAGSKTTLPVASTRRFPCSVTGVLSRIFNSS